MGKRIAGAGSSRGTKSEFASASLSHTLSLSPWSPSQRRRFFFFFFVSEHGTFEVVTLAAGFKPRGMRRDGGRRKKRSRTCAWTTGDEGLDAPTSISALARARVSSFFPSLSLPPARFQSDGILNSLRGI